MNTIKKGSIVTVTDSRFCHARWSNFARRHLQYMLRWAYSHLPKEGAHYRVLGVHRDTVVIQGMVCAVKKMNPIYFMDINGIKLESQEN